MVRTGIGTLHINTLTCLNQALFTEGLGNPKLEYMLISNAARLAQSKGLHLDISGSSGPRDDKELEYRSVLFWSIYCYEKHNSSCSDRASVCVTFKFQDPKS